MHTDVDLYIYRWGANQAGWSNEYPVFFFFAMNILISNFTGNYDRCAVIPSP